MDILITDYHCASNRGDAAILEGELAALREEFPGAEMTVMTEYPAAADILHDVWTVAQRIPPFHFTDWKKNAALAAILIESNQGYNIVSDKFIKSRLELQPYYDADLVISTGGQYITDAYFPSKIAVLAELIFCVQLGTPTALYAQSLGPFEQRQYRPFIKHALNSVDVITTRDEKSVRYLEKLGITNPSIHSLADAAFTMPLSKSSMKLEQYAIEDIGPIVNDNGPLISISVRPWSRFDTGSEDNYLNAIATVTEWLIETHDARVIFASTCTGLAGYHTDDRLAAHDVLLRLDDDIYSSVNILTGEYSPQQLVNIYAKMDLHIGTRMHSNILAMLGGTAIVPIEYQFKTTGLMKQFGLQNSVLDIEQLTEETLINRVANNLTNREMIVEQIESKLPIVKESSRRNAQVIREAITR